MRILVVCDEGNNRSVTIASRIKYLGHDVLTAGLRRNDPGTLRMLAEWADRIITTDTDQHFNWPDPDRVRLWCVGPDRYKRPFNPQLLAIVNDLIAQHREADLGQ